MRSQFAFYKSFDDVSQDLNNSQLAAYMRVLLDVQFLRVKIEDVKFEDALLNIVWKSQKHSIETSIKGYLDSQKRESVKNPYMGIYADSCNPSEGVAQQEERRSNKEEVIKNKEEGEEKEEGKEEEQEAIPYLDIIQYLNSKVNGKYMASGNKTKKLIKARISEGFTLEDFKTVIDKKSTEWLSDTKMSAFLRPETLFSNKFEGYLNQVVAKSRLDIKNTNYEDQEEF